jgi:hypothetical protein
MNDIDDRPLTAEETLIAGEVIDNINVMTELVVRLTGAGEDGAVDALVVAEGVLARLIGAYAQAQRRHDRAALEQLLVISDRHIRELAGQYWQHLEDRPDVAPDA